MSKFMITCPICGRYNEASTGFFASKRIHCTCGNIINVKTDKMASCRCTNCGNDVVYDQSKARDAKCPVCGEHPTITELKDDTDALNVCDLEKA